MGEEGNSSSSIIFFRDIVYKWLDAWLESGFTEKDFWDSTIAELIRAMTASRKREKLRLQEKAYFDYRLASLIYYSIGTNITNKIKFPEIEEFYSGIFDADKIQESKEEIQSKKFAAQLKLFSIAHNAKLQKEENNLDE